jgi:hypothetical protein
MEKPTIRIAGLLVFIILLVSSLQLPIVSALALSDSQSVSLHWSKTYGYVAGKAIAQLNDGNFIVAADTGDSPVYAGHFSYDFANRGGALLKIDFNGNVLWKKSLPLNPSIMIETKDGFTLAGSIRRLAGYSTYNGQKEYDNFVSLAHVDFKGNVLWNRTYDNITEHRIAVNAAIQTEDGGLSLEDMYMIFIKDG